jgi:fluoride exporter
MNAGHLKLYLWVAVGGALGSLLRFAISVAWLNWIGTGFPWATLLANVLGSLLIGFVAARAGSHDSSTLSEDMQLFLMAGFCGGLTTFSLVSLELGLMMQIGDWHGASAYLGLSLAGWLTSVAAGYRLGSRKYIQD